MSDRRLQARTFVGLDESDRVARRARKYPANWSELSDDEVYALSGSM